MGIVVAQLFAVVEIGDEDSVIQSCAHTPGFEEKHTVQIRQVHTPENKKTNLNTFEIQLVETEIQGD